MLDLKIFKLASANFHFSLLESYYDHCVNGPETKESENKQV